ncbi:MAG TPA: cupin domain-containing protein [Caulobacteraceae bacterium]|nr:cupin domain-containing protein [Caulobacteraceae bacterium]
MSHTPSHPGDQGQGSRTLGDVLYAQSEAPVAEDEWALLVQSIAEGDELALHALYERAHRIVFTLIVRITGSREAAEELTIDVFEDVWRGAAGYDGAKRTVLAWIMDQAQSRALARAGAADPPDPRPLRKQARSLRAALPELSPYERQAIETTYFAGLTHAEAAARLYQPAGAIMTRIRSGLHKLGAALTPRGDFEQGRCAQSRMTCAYVAEALAPGEVAVAEAHIDQCADCRREQESLRTVIEQFAAWPTNLLRPSASLQERLARRIAEESGKALVPPPQRRWCELDWEAVAPGIECKLLGTDEQRRRVSMLVRLAPDASYPAHTHAGDEELHLLDGELWIDERKLVPGDYNYGAPGASDERVWSETGCTCLLVTSTEDVLQ